MTNPKQGEIYRHHSGKLYEIQEPVYCADTGDLMVMYKQIDYKTFKEAEAWRPDLEPLVNDDDRNRWIHTVENFNKKGRFEKVR